MPTRTITFRIPGPEELLASLGLSRQQIERSLELIREKYGPPDKLTPGEYTIELPEEAVIYDFTNQAVITAIYRLAEEEGENGWALLKRAGLTHLVRNRYERYKGPPIDQLVGLTPDERRRLAELLGLTPPAIPEEVETPVINWVGPIPNCDSGRSGYSIDFIVIHYTAAGSAESTISWFKNPMARVSAHYLIARNGTIYQLVQDEDTAWHAGIPRRKGLSEEENRERDRRRQLIRPNERGIGIEIANWGVLKRDSNRYYIWPNNWKTPFDGPVVKAGNRYWEQYTDAQYESLIKLVRYLCSKHSIPPAYPPKGPGAYHEDPEELARFRGILGHNALDNTKIDPGKHFDWDRLINGLV